MGRSITEPGDITLELCDFNNILRLKAVRELTRVTRPKSIESTNHMHPMKMIKDESSYRKGSDMIELINPDGTSKNVSRKEHSEK